LEYVSSNILPFPTLRDSGAFPHPRSQEHWWWDTAKPNDGGAVNDPEIRNFLKRVLDKAGWPRAAGVIRKVKNPTNRSWLVVWNMIFIFPYIWEESPQLTNIFQRG